MASSSSTLASSSMEHDIHSSIFLLSNICNLISIRLESSNYVLWKFQLTAILKAHKLFGFLDGSNPKLAQFLPSGVTDVSCESAVDVSSGSAVSKIIPLFEDWIAKNQAFLTLISVTLSPVALAYVVGSDTSKQVWEILEKYYSSNSRTNVVNLKLDLQSIIKKSGEPIADYIKQMKEIKDKLANVSTVVNEEDLIIYTLNGHPAEFNTFRTSLLGVLP